MGSKRTTIQEKLSFMIGSMEVDTISTKDFHLGLEAIEHAVSAEIFDKKVKVVTPEYLILLKLIPCSPQDKIDIIMLIKKVNLKTLRILAEKHSLLHKFDSMLRKTGDD